MRHIASTAELIDEIESAETVRVAGGGTKPALSGDATLCLSQLRGVVEYQPSEYTMTVLAGTPLAELNRLLDEQGQYLPCDLPLARAGATIGGAAAAGVSGAGRFRYGGIRDFLLGVQLATGAGELVRLGSRVVKNAAGFDFPKLLIGSLGRLGVMTELTVKVFPKPEARQTVIYQTDNFQAAIDLMLRLGAAPLELQRLDLVDRREVWAQVAGNGEAVAGRVKRLLELAEWPSRTLAGDDDLRAWDDANEFAWAPADHGIVKIAVSPTSLLKYTEALDPLPVRFSAGGHLLWLAWPPDRTPTELKGVLDQYELRGVALTGSWPEPLMGASRDESFADRLRSVLDPTGKFAPQSIGPQSIGVLQ